MENRMLRPFQSAVLVEGVREKGGQALRLALSLIAVGNHVPSVAGGAKQQMFYSGVSGFVFPPLV